MIKQQGTDWGQYPIQIINGLITTERGVLESSTRKGLQQLANTMVDLGYTSCVEIGAYAGEGTEIFAEVFDTVTVIDPWKNGYDKEDLSSEMYDMELVYKSYCKRTEKFDNIIEYDTSDQCIKDTPDSSIDFVYIDAIHKCGPVKDELWKWLRKITPDGAIGGHDFTGYWGEVVDAIIDTIGLPEYIFEDKSWVKTKETIYCQENILNPQIVSAYLAGNGKRPR